MGGLPCKHQAWHHTETSGLNRGVPTAPKVGFAGWDAHALANSWIATAGGCREQLGLADRVSLRAPALNQRVWYSLAR